MDKSTADAYIEDLLEERSQLLEEIHKLREELMRLSLSYVDKIINNNHHIIDKVHE